jgi:hypothetical protein
MEKMMKLNFKKNPILKVKTRKRYKKSYPKKNI